MLAEHLPLLVRHEDELVGVVGCRQSSPARRVGWRSGRTRGRRHGRLGFRGGDGVRRWAVGGQPLHASSEADGLGEVVHVRV